MFLQLNNIMKVGAFIILCTLCFVSNVKAETTEEDYNKLRSIFSDARISLMSDEEKAIYTDNEVTVDKKLYKGTLTVNNTYTYEEIDPSLADDIAANSQISTYDAFYQTTYKQISFIDAALSNNVHQLTVYTQWLITPVTQSYDVTAMRVEDAYIVEGTQTGLQVYKKNGVVGSVNYSPNGTNIRKEDDGFGISMNLVNNATSYETDISANVVATSQYAKAYGTYQHAVTDVTLDASQSYTISHNGFGDVLNFATGVQNWYDGMNGVSISLSYS